MGKSFRRAMMARGEHEIAKGEAMTIGRHPISFVATTDPVTARSFYGGTLGLTLIEHSPYALVFREGAALLRVQIVSHVSAAAHTVHGWRVADIAADIADLSSKGVTFLLFEGMDQTAQGIWQTPDAHKIAWFKDPDGNILSLTEFAQG